MKFQDYILFGLLILGFMSGTLAAAISSEAAVPISENGEHGISSRTLNTDGTSEMWLINNSWTIAAGTLGAIALVGGLAAAFYYFYYLNYYGYSGDALGANQYNQHYSGGQQQYAGNYYAPNSRAFDTGSSGKWNISWTQVLYMISLAQETYEKFDYQSMDCQKKTLCELAQKQGDLGETGEKTSNTFSVMDAIEALPMPEIIENYLKEYREAINQGRNSAKDCSAIYSRCGFSIRDILTKYQMKAAAGKF